MSARDRILQATLRLIGEEGIGAVTNRAVARAAGVSLGSLTYHFPSQDDLLREALQTFVDEEISRITAYVTALADSGMAPVEAADAVEKAVVDFAYGPEQIANLELHLHAARDPVLRETSARSVDAYDRLAGAVLAALGIPDAERHAPTIVAMLYGLAVRRLATGDTTGTGTSDAFRLLLLGALPRT
ncbi:TetR/AcrR family transcriptional regulator [Actinomadura sp. GC306]|uniref:TetR/AcrR family transcriptional regulator n=1 Tax=Actinomadura sp. GC306 TaxID=2530367 RepID=UPI001050C5FA|nr:TetR family transcriptional regulator [Actinomadura sp. GC306]TDC67139.1 TetR/AcrR family transcriptional regulator [Actinomadura sp. GC306]